MGNGDVLEAERLEARRGYTTLFTGVAFTVHAGEALVVNGPNGSGKTTLLRIVAGLTQPFDGEVRWRNQPVDPFSVRMRNDVAFNGHLPALKDELSVEENLAYWIALDCGTCSHSTFGDALEKVALGRQRKLPARVLSQGQRRRVGLARLSLSCRTLWILDEPLTALDMDGVDILRELLDAHLERGGLCVAASHQPLPMTKAREKTLTLATQT
jgi:heme exporter protein A